jgi:hypothetical protein
METEWYVCILYAAEVCGSRLRLTIGVLGPEVQFEGASSQNVGTLPVPTTLASLVAPETLQAASGGAAREARRDLVRRLPPPHRGVVDRDDCEVVWLDRGYVRGVGDGDGRAAKVGDVGRFTKGVHDVERSGGLLGRSAAVSSRRGRSPRWALN